MYYLVDEINPLTKKVISSEPPIAIIITMTSSNDQSIRRPRN